MSSCTNTAVFFSCCLILSTGMGQRSPERSKYIGSSLSITRPSSVLKPPAYSRSGFFGYGTPQSSDPTPAPDGQKQLAIHRVDGGNRGLYPPGTAPCNSRHPRESPLVRPKPARCLLPCCISRD